MNPWDDTIPAADLENFHGAANSMHRPMEVGTRPALIVVDMTMAFVDSAYPTGYSPTGYPAVAATRLLLDSARELGIPIYFTKAHEDPKYVATPAERGRWKPSQSARNEDLPPGDVIAEDLRPLPGEVIVYKQSKPSGFFGTNLAAMLMYHNVDTTVIVGMTTSGCVRATVLDAFSWNFHVLIPHEAVADRSEISHKVNLFDLHMKYADVASVADTVAYFERCTSANEA
jgi:maleamate amidohydrolase